MPKSKNEIRELKHRLDKESSGRNLSYKDFGGKQWRLK